MLRAAVKAGTLLGIEAKKVMDAGGLVRRHHHRPDRDRLTEADCKSGFPVRRLPAHHPAGRRDEGAGVKIDIVLEIDVPDDEIIGRMSGPARAAFASARSHLPRPFNPPKVEGQDDETGEPLIQRDDDKEENRQEAPRRVSFPDQTAGGLPL